MGGKEEKESDKKPDWVSGSFGLGDRRGIDLIEGFTDFWKEKLGGRPLLAEWLGILSAIAASAFVVLGVHFWAAFEDMEKDRASARREAALSAWLSKDCRAADYIDNSPFAVRALFDDAVVNYPALKGGA